MSTRFQTAIDAATAQGHAFVDDPPANELSRAARVTCRRCGRALLALGTEVWGSAAEGPCEGEASR